MTSQGIVSCGGFFTLLRYVESLDSSTLERALGYEKGRLSYGFVVVALCDDELLAPADFELKASSRWSGGKIKPEDQLSGGADIEQILADRGQDLAQIREKVSRFFTLHRRNTPAKVLPHLGHSSASKYPDAEALGPGRRSGVPQFRLIHPKRFSIVRASP